MERLKLPIQSSRASSSCGCLKREKKKDLWTLSLNVAKGNVMMVLSCLHQRQTENWDSSLFIRLLNKAD